MLLPFFVFSASTFLFYDSSEIIGVLPSLFSVHYPPRTN